MRGVGRRSRTPTPRRNLSKPSLRAGVTPFLGDLHEYDIASATWKDLSTPSSGSAPSGRRMPGVVAVSLYDKLYVFYGQPGEPRSALLQLTFPRFVPCLFAPRASPLCLASGSLLPGTRPCMGILPPPARFLHPFGSFRELSCVRPSDSHAIGWCRPWCVEQRLA